MRPRSAPAALRRGTAEATEAVRRLVELRSRIGRYRSDAGELVQRERPPSDSPSFDAKRVVRYETCLGTADRALSRIVGERARSARRIRGQHEMAIVGGRNGHRYESR